MKFCQNVPYMDMLKMIRYQVSACMRLKCFKENIGVETNLPHSSRNRVNEWILSFSNDFVGKREFCWIMIYSFFRTFA